MKAEITTRPAIRTQLTKQTFYDEWGLIRVQERFSKCNDIAACLKSGAPTIGEVEVVYGRDFIQAYIEGWIVNLREFVNVQREVSNTQANTIAGMIVNEFQNLNIADINLIFKNAKMGRYGAFYGRLDGQMILSWFSEYFNDRCVAAAEQSVSEAHSVSLRDNHARMSKGKSAAELVGQAKSKITR